MHHHKRILIYCFILLLFSVSYVYGSDSKAFSPHTLTLLNVSPQPGAKAVSSGTKTITLMFDRPVVPVTALGQSQSTPGPLVVGTGNNAPQIATTDPSIVPTVTLFTPTPAPLPSLLSITPAVMGTGQWVHPAIYEFTLAEKALQGGITYHVSLDPTLKAVDGSRLEQPFEWSFQVADPQVIDIVPTQGSKDGVWLESGFSISFSQPMDHTTTEAAFKLYKNRGGACGDGCSADPQFWDIVAGAFTWKEASTRMIFTPAQPLEYSERFYDPKYRAELGASARNASGTLLMTSAYAYFRPVFPPYVSSTNPIEGDSVPPGRRRITIAFGGQMNPESYRDQYRVEPEPPGGVTPYVNKDGTLSLEFEHVLDQTYTVTILKGVKDVYGTSMAKFFSLTYTVRRPQPQTHAYLVMPSNQYLAIATPSQTPGAFRLHATGSPNIAVEIYRANVEMLLQVNQEYSMSLVPHHGGS